MQSNWMHAALSTILVGGAVLTSLWGSANAQDLQTKASAKFISVIPLKDSKGEVRANIRIVGTKLTFENSAGVQLTADLPSTRSLPPISDVQIPDGEKADSFDQKSLNALQAQIDALLMKMIELTGRVNELSK